MEANFVCSNPGADLAGPFVKFSMAQGEHKTWNLIIHPCKDILATGTQVHVCSHVRGIFR